MRWSLKQTVLLAAAACTLGCQSDSQPGANKFEPLAFLQKTQENVEEALRIEPKVEPAPDPTRLSSKSGPVKPNLHVSAAALMERNGQLDAAREHYQQALEMEPSNRAALIGIARLHHRAGALPEAVAAYQHAVRVVGKDPTILNDLALCLAHARRHPEAIETLRTVVALKPDSLMYRNNLAAVLVEANRADEAVQVLAESHGLAVAHYNVGYLLTRHGQPAAASAHFAQSLRVNPSFEPARTMLDRVLPQVGSPSQPRIANGPSPAASASNTPILSPGSSTVAVPFNAGNGMPNASGAVPAEALAGASADPAAPVELWTGDTSPSPVQPADFSVAVPPATEDTHAAATPPIEVAQLPPIRFPVSYPVRRTPQDGSGLVAPAPVAP